MRAWLVLLLLLASLSALAPAAGEGGYGSYCPDYDVLDADAGLVGAKVSSWPIGALVIKVGNYYLIEDIMYVNAIGQPYLFSWWLYEESGYAPGLQRWDAFCDDCPFPSGPPQCDFNLTY